MTFSFILAKYKDYVFSESAGMLNCMHAYVCVCHGILTNSVCFDSNKSEFDLSIIVFVFLNNTLIPVFKILAWSCGHKGIVNEWLSIQV